VTDAAEESPRPDDAHRSAETTAAPAGGVEAVKAARDLLATVPDAPLDEHVAMYEDVHRRLQEGLADLDED
jgi:hypothetical protein